MAATIQKRRRAQGPTFNSKRMRKTRLLIAFTLVVSSLWLAWREVFPERFYQIADLQEAIGPGAYFLQDEATGGRMKLRDLPLGAGRHKEPEIQCSFFCDIAEQDILKGK